MEPKVASGFPAQPPVPHGATVQTRRQRVPWRTRQKPAGEDATVNFVVEGKKTMRHLLWKPNPQRLAAQRRTVGPNPAMTVEQTYAQKVGHGLNGDVATQQQASETAKSREELRQLFAKIVPCEPPNNVIGIPALPRSRTTLDEFGCPIPTLIPKQI
jgi:hypothetical protein